VGFSNLFAERTTESERPENHLFPITSPDISASEDCNPDLDIKVVPSVLASQVGTTKRSERLMAPDHFSLYERPRMAAFYLYDPPTFRKPSYRESEIRHAV